MLKTKLIQSLVLAFAILALPISAVFAAPAAQEGFISGTVTALVCETDATTGITTFLVTVEGADGTSQTVRIDQLTAYELGLISLDESGNPDCSEEALAEAIGLEVEIDPALVIPDEQEPQHPVGGALATFFADITDYETIMAAHEEGVGFGVIAQALWMTKKLEGDSEVFLAILEAKETKDFSAFVFADGTSPTNWGQFKKVVMNGEKGNLGIVMSGRDEENGNGNGNGNGNNGNGNNGNGNGNGNGNNGNGNGNGNGNNGNGRNR